MDIGALKCILGEDLKDDMLKFAANTAEEYIKNYCGIETVPARLEFTALNIAADIYRAVSTEKNGADIKSIREGDVSVSFDRLKGGIGELKKSYDVMLDMFRKAGW